MCLLSVLSVLGMWALLNPGSFCRQVLVLHGRIEVLFDRGKRVGDLTRDPVRRREQEGLAVSNCA
jgi:hypothetical protein